MINTKFILADGQEIYPGYLDKEQRQTLKEHHGTEREFMWCGCRPGEKMYYRISEDLRIYPEHNNYIHDKYCIRYKSDTGETARQTAYVINDEDGDVTAYLEFNPKKFDIKSDIETEQNNPVSEEEKEESQNEAIVEKQKKTVKIEEKKEPELSLAELIRSINVDAFTEKMLNDKIIASQENFSKFVYHRMQRVRIHRMQKKIGELSLENDGVRFIYAPFAGAIKKKERGLVKYYLQTKGKAGEIFNNLIFGETFERVVKEFGKNYGIEPDENTMLAGFQYYKKSRSKSMYRVLGRVHLFQISELGIYCRSRTEQEAFDVVCQIAREDKDVKFWIPPEDESIGGIIQIKGKKKKILLLFRTAKDERILFDKRLYEPLVVDDPGIITKELLYEYAMEEIHKESEGEEQ